MVDTNSSMMLSQRLKNEFAADVRQRAELDVRSHAVRIRDSTSWNLMATVGAAEVSIDLDHDDLYLWCDCDYLQETGEGCEHLWATILVAEQKQLLKEAMRRPDLNVMFIDETDSWDPDRGFDENPMLMNGGKKISGPNRHRLGQLTRLPRTPPNREKNQSNEWSRAFGQIRQMLGRTSADFRIGIGTKASSSSTCWTFINRRATRTCFLELTHQERKKDGNWSKPSFIPSHKSKPSNSLRIRTRRLCRVFTGAQQNQGVRLLWLRIAVWSIRETRPDAGAAFEPDRAGSSPVSDQKRMRYSPSLGTRARPGNFGCK